MDFQISINQSDYKAIDKVFTLYPKLAKKEFTKAFKEGSAPIVEAVRISSFSALGAHSVGVSPGQPKTKRGENRQHLIAALQATMRFRGDEKKRFGGFVRIDFGDKKRSDNPAYIGWMHEVGTQRGLPARKPLETGLAPYVDRFQVIADKVIDKILGRANV